MKDSNRIILACCLLLAGYGACTTVHICRLESRIARMESSHESLARYTYDFGAAFLGGDTVRGVRRADLARIILLEMEQDPMLRPAIHSSRVRYILPRETQSLRNTIERVSQ